MKQELLKFQITFYDENNKFILSCGEYAFDAIGAEAKARKSINNSKKNGYYKDINFKHARVSFFPGTRYGKE